MKKIILAFLVATAGLNRVDLGAAQKPASVRKIGFLAFTEGPSGAKEVLRRSLAEVGYREGHNIVIEFRGAEERLKLIELANELIQNKVEVIVASGGLAARSAKEASTTIPIVFAISSEPVAAGLVESIARPGRNMTGMSWLSFELVGKRVELLKEAAPRLSRIAILSNPQHAGEERELHETQKTAKALGITLDYYQTRTAVQFQTAFDNIARQKTNGLLVFPEPASMANRLRIIEFAAKQRLPNMFGWKEFVEAGALMSYGPNRDESFKRVAVFVDKILKGTKPADLPVEVPHKFELVMNLKTAKQIRLTIPPNVLVRADRVIR